MQRAESAPVENACYGRMGEHVRHQRIASLANSQVDTCNAFARSGRRHAQTLKVLLAGALCGAAPLTSGAGPVHADSPGPRDQKYIDLLTSEGLGCSTDVPCTATGTDQDLIQLGQTICAALRSGRSEQGLINYPPGGVAVDRYRAGILIGISEAAFCPGISAPPGATRLIQPVPKTFDA